jgi:hypothetical protein
MDITLINNYGLLILVIIFFVINLYYKNLINILIFLIVFIALQNFISTEHSLIIAYIISLIYGIARNFHLLENFKNYITGRKSKGKESFIVKKNGINGSKSTVNKTKNNNKTTNNEKQKYNNFLELESSDAESNNESENESENEDTFYENIDSIISEDLINEFINKVKEVDDLLITHEKKNIYSLKPIIKKLSKNKIKKMKADIKEKDDSFIYKPIVISKDNFILDGHHRWFLRKNLIEENTSGTNYKLYNEDIDVVIIDYNINVLIRKLQEFKIKFNKNLLSQNILDKNKVNDGKMLIKRIKNDITKLEKNYNQLNKLKIL